MNKRLFLICAVAWPTLAPAMSNPNFTPCTLTGTTPGVSVEAECSRWVVPENREQPDGRTIELLFARVPAVSKSPRPDPVVLLAGGPGQSATETYPQLAGVLANMHIPLADLQAAMYAARQSGYDTAIADFVDSHSDLVDSWFADDK